MIHVALKANYHRIVRNVNIYLRCLGKLQKKRVPNYHLASTADWTHTHGFGHFEKQQRFA